MPLDPHEVQAETVRYLVAKNQELAAEVARLQDLADARLYRARAARVTLESVGIPRSEPVDVSAARAASMIEDLRAEVARLTAALADAQAGPVVKWQDHPQVGLLGEDRSWSVVERGHFRLWVDVDGWHLLCSLPGLPANRSIASGPETGDAGKAACEAAYRRAVGLPPRTVCPPVATAIITSTL